MHTCIRTSNLPSSYSKLCCLWNLAGKRQPKQPIFLRCHAQLALQPEQHPYIYT